MLGGNRRQVILVVRKTYLIVPPPCFSQMDINGCSFFSQIHVTFHQRLKISKKRVIIESTQSPTRDTLMRRGRETSQCLNPSAPTTSFARLLKPRPRGGQTKQPLTFKLFLVRFSQLPCLLKRKQSLLLYFHIHSKGLTIKTSTYPYERLR